MIPTLITILNTIELFGSYGARHVESGTSVDLTNRRNRRTTKSPIPVVCRELIAHGHNPQERAHVIRKSLLSDAMIPVFKRDRTLEAWAAVDCVESDTRSPQVVTHRPFPDSLSHADEQEGGRVGKGSLKLKRRSTESLGGLGAMA